MCSASNTVGWLPAQDALAPLGELIHVLILFIHPFLQLQIGQTVPESTSYLRYEINSSSPSDSNTYFGGEFNIYPSKKGVSHVPETANIRKQL